MDAPLTLQTLLAPAELKCPLSNRLFVDPVIAGTFGKAQSVSVCVSLALSVTSPFLVAVLRLERSRNILDSCRYTPFAVS